VDGPVVCPPLTGVYELNGSGSRRGLGLLRFCNWLLNKADEHGAEMIFYEAPIYAGMPGTGNVKFLLIGLAAMTEMIAASIPIRCENQTVQTIRKNFISNGHGNKAMVMARCDQLRWEYGGDDNRADAAAAWFSAKLDFDRAFRFETVTPLFSNAAVRAQGKVA